jgi:hypothetical protein
MTFLRLVWPAAIVTDERATFKSLEINSIHASLARPSTGGEVKESLRASPSSPEMAFFLARGWTLMAKVAPCGVSFTGIKCLSLHREDQLDYDCDGYDDHLWCV